MRAEELRATKEWNDLRYEAMSGKPVPAPAAAQRCCRKCGGSESIWPCHYGGDHDLGPVRAEESQRIDYPTPDPEGYAPPTPEGPSARSPRPAAPATTRMGEEEFERLERSTYAEVFGFTTLVLAEARRARASEKAIYEDSLAAARAYKVEIDAARAALLREGIRTGDIEASLAAAVELLREARFELSLRPEPCSVRGCNPGAFLARIDEFLACQKEGT